MLSFKFFILFNIFLFVWWKKSGTINDKQKKKQK